MAISVRAGAPPGCACARPVFAPEHLWGSVEAERRQVTVLFTDLVGFTTFSEKSGEEAAFLLMRSLSKLMAEAVREQGGVVQNFTGDGIMAVFGAPIAFEDAPLRACRAALTILRRLKEAGPELESKHCVRPQMRIGLNTGAAVVGRVEDGADAGVTVLGDTVNFAARLQALAEPDSVLMSEATYHLMQGMVEATFAGDRQIKGKAEQQKVYRLKDIRKGATRFEAAVGRGLSTFVGREHELNVLERSLDKARTQLCVIDLVAEPGMGKSRLLHEFRQRIVKDRVFILTGSCSPDGQQTPFLPFIEVVRGSFRVSAGEAEKDIAQKLDTGLTTLGLYSVRNLGLLLHLLGLKTPEDALTGLDGVLIGLRTRELLQQLLEARCRLSPVVMVIEDLHWIDSVSEELLAKIVDSDVKLQLLLLQTRRPEYVPTWLGRATVTELPLEPLSAGDILRLVQTRFAVASVPEKLAQQLAEKVEGNPLFAEEIVSFLTERGIVVRAAGGKLDFHDSAVAAALPASVESLLTARVDRLDPRDRTLLQAAAVIGRQFDAELLAVVTSESTIPSRLAAMQTVDLIHPETKSNDFVFKHVLVRDALYQSLLSEPRKALHLKIAEEIERRSGNRLVEVAEVLAHHYRQTDRPDRAFTYLSMAGAKSLSVYSLDQAEIHLAAALALLDKKRDCASDEQIVDFLVYYMLLLNLTGHVNVTIGVVRRYLPRVGHIDDAKLVLIRYHYAHALLLNARYHEALAAQREVLSTARRLGDSRSVAYALAGEILITTVVEPKSQQEFELLKTEALLTAVSTHDPYVQNQARFVIGWEEAARGRMDRARVSALELLEIGRLLNDPRSTGFGLWLLAFISLFSDSYAEALDYSEQALATVITPVDRIIASGGRAISIVLLRRIDEGAALLEEHRRHCANDGFFYLLAGSDAAYGICQMLQGNIAKGIRFIEDAVASREKEGLLRLADWTRLNLAEAYLEVIAGNEKPSIVILLKNLPILLRVIAFGPSRILGLTTHVLNNPYLDRAGYYSGRAHMILGLFYKAKNKRSLAVKHLGDARRIFSQFGDTPALTRVETVLSQLA